MRTHPHSKLFFSEDDKYVLKENTETADKQRNRQTINFRSQSLKKYVNRRTLITLNLLRGGRSKLDVGNKENYTVIETMGDNYEAQNSMDQKGKKKKMYLTCIAIVLLWISTGTIFYSKFNHWPLAQSFFYAVDAGMSIGFCTDVAETKIGSRAFTIVFIILGASCVGGALALFIQDIMEGAVELRNCEFEQILAKDAFDRADKDCDGKIDYSEFLDLIQNWTGMIFSDDQFHKLCDKFDSSHSKYITSKTFLKKIGNMDKLLTFEGPFYSNNFILRKATEQKETLIKTFSGRNRIFTACLAWVLMGIFWGRNRMKWDIITATHFAISALATGGLTAPSVNEDGILPLEPALFCGVFCLIGIPLLALTLAHFARALVESQVFAEEKNAISRPLTRKEFDYAKSLCSPQDQMVHLSDFIVLQLLRMGKVNMETIELMKTQFKNLDVDGSGKLFQSTMMQKINSTTQDENVVKKE